MDPNGAPIDPPMDPHGTPIDPRELQSGGVVRKIATVGHSNRSIEAFLEILAAHGVRQIADVRRFPASRRSPHFSAEALRVSLPLAGVAYEGMPGLGGHRTPRPDSPHTAWRVDAFRGYADFMDTPEFQSARGKLEERATNAWTAVMCAEALPWRCHRSLVADSLLARGWQVSEILSEKEARFKKLPDFARLEGERVVYDGGQRKLV